MLGHKGKSLQLKIKKGNYTYFDISFAECIHLLLAHNAQVKIKNGLGWNPLAEAISYGDRQTS